MINNDKYTVTSSDGKREREMVQMKHDESSTIGADRIISVPCASATSPVNPRSVSTLVLRSTRRVRHGYGPSTGTSPRRMKMRRNVSGAKIPGAVAFRCFLKVSCSIFMEEEW